MIPFQVWVVEPWRTFSCTTSKKIVPKVLIDPADLNDLSVETALRQHRGAPLANPARKNGQSACAADQQMPLMRGWSGQGQRAAGTAQRLDWRVLLQLE
jgi:hypothetical protein